MGLEDEVGVDVGGKVLCDELFLLASRHDLECVLDHRLEAEKPWGENTHSSFAPASRPMS